MRHVVVLGAGMAGLLAAAALARPGRTVTVVERDDLPDTPRPRRGVPQSPQPHIYLHRGLAAIEDLLPGTRADLLAAGALAIDTGDLAWLASAGWSAPVPQLDILSVSRPVFEHVVRARVLRLPGVVLRTAAHVDGLAHAPVGGPDSHPWAVEVAGDEPLLADLVVDATGRSSRLPVWLEHLGVSPPRTDLLDARVGYASWVVDLPHDRVGVPGIVVQAQPGAPGGIALPVEGDRWIVGVVGAGDLRPPRDADGLRALLDALPDPAIAELADAGSAVSDVAVHRQTGNQRHRYDLLPDWPDGLLAVGDALCAFNPVYGQGVTVAALEAVALRTADRRGRLARPGGTRALLRRFRRLADLPWGIATGVDRDFVPTARRASPVDRAMGRWIGEVNRLGTHGDTRAQLALGRLYHLVGSPLALLHPALVAPPPPARPPLGAPRSG
ncbi:NAD(P)-binding protein, partial [Cellulomonas fimi]|uniref:NAD(P)/FAD-dependent oxidoreductase n=1 Tax=Cellulomonas fimi TaxID=1708 RepID=UPI00234D9324